MSTLRHSHRGAGVLLATLICAVLAVSGLDSTVNAQSPDIDYHLDDNGLIEVTSEAQLNAIGLDLDGNGVVDNSTYETDYSAAFPSAANRMGCPARGCTGYEVAENISLSSNPDWEPIGNTTTNFTATFEGNAPSYTISNLVINRTTDYVGLFGVTGTRSAIRNVKLTGVRVTGNNNVGALVGLNGDATHGGGQIDNCEATGTVTGNGWLGGLVGTNYGRISGSRASGAVTATRTDGSAFAGGLVGQNLTAPIRNSHASGNVTGSASRVGGLVGSNYDVSAANGSATPRNAISGSTARGTVTTTGYNVGGLVGWNNGPISDSTALNPNVSGAAYVGGLVGQNNDAQADGSNPISGSSASGAVTATGNSVGGLVGWSNGPITGSVATGPVTGTATSGTVGGLVGQSGGSISGSAATGAVSGGHQVGGLVGFAGTGGSVTESWASGAVTGIADASVSRSGMEVGGLIGLNEGTVGASFATGNVTGVGQAGGLIGRQSGAVVATYATGNVTDSGDVPCIPPSFCPEAEGGLIGFALSSVTPSTVQASYSTGRVRGSSTTDFLGGLVGLARRGTPVASFTDSYWDTATSGRTLGVGSDDEDANGMIDAPESATAGVTGQTTTALRTPIGYTGIFADWSVTIPGVAARTGDPWDFGGTTDYPVLRGLGPPPSFPSRTVRLSVAEELAAGTPIGSPLTATGGHGGTLTYKLVGADVAFFSIDGMTGQLSTKTLLDYENPVDANRDNTYEFMIQASDGTTVTFRTVAVTVTDTIENLLPPIIVGSAAVTVAENSTAVAIYGAQDPDGATSTFTWSLGGNDAGAFNISDGGVLTFNEAPNFEIRADFNRDNVYKVTVQADDGGMTGDFAVTVAVENVDEPADISFVATGGVTVNNNALTVDENYDGTLATFTASDPENDQTLAYTWSTDAPFAITAAGVLSFVNIPDHERPADSGGNNVYDITVNALDSDNKTGSLAVTVTVTNLDEAGAVALTVDEPVMGRPLTATLSDSDGGVLIPTWTWAWSTSSTGSFTPISSASSATYTPVPEDVGRYLKASVSYTDSQGSGKTAEMTSANAVAANPPPVFDPTSVTFAVNENATTGTVGTVTAADPDNDAITYSLGGAGAAFNEDFSLGSTSGAITVKTGATIDHESKASYSVTITATDTVGIMAGEVATVSAQSVVPSAPTGLSGTLRDDDSVALDWADTSGATSYQLSYRHFHVSAWVDLPVIGVTVTMTGSQAVVSGLPSPVNYYFRVRASNSEGSSDWSEEALVTPAPTVGVDGCTIEAPPAPLARFDKYCSAGGVGVVGSEAVSDFAVKRAWNQITNMLAAHPTVRQRMAQAGAHHQVDAASESPQSPRYTSTTRHSRAPEANLLCYFDSFPRNYSFLVHEFAHAMYDAALSDAERQEVTAAYNAAMGAGLWENKYARNSDKEYWAEAVEAYFSGATQGINFNHEEMAEHDSRIYEMLLRYLPANGWRVSCPHSSEAPPPPAKPPAPVNLRATTVTQTIVTLTWEVPPSEEGNVQRYHIVRSDDEAQSWWVVATIPADRTTFAVTGLTPDYLYSFAIEAGNGYRETMGPWKAVRTSPSDNDHVPVALSWSAASPTVAEADGTLVLMAQVTTLVDKAPENGFTVSLTAATADGTATQPADYAAVSESFSFTPTDFSAVTVGGAQRYRATRAFTFSVVNDAVDEPSEAFTVTLAYTGAAMPHLTGSSAVANVTLRDSNQAEVTIEWDETALTAAEPDTAGGATMVTLTAVATTMGQYAPDPGFGLDFTVVTADGTATQPADYTGLSTSGSFDETDFSSVTVAGNPRYRATMDFTVSVADDTIDEPDETFTATLALADSNIAYLFTGDVTSTVTITDNDHVPVTLSWDDASITVDEVATTITLTAQVTTETDKAPETGFTVALSVASANGTATAGTDYTAVTDTYSYSPGDFTRVQVGTVHRYRATKAFDVAILHDTADEPDETFTLTFAYAGMDLPPHLKGASAVATVTITDNDHVPVELSWDGDAISVDENAGAFTLTAQLTTTRDKAPETGFTAGLSVASANGTAVAPGDYAAVSESFSFTPTDFSAVTGGGAQRYRATRAFTFSVVNDAVDEPGEAFTVTLAYTGAAMPHLTGSSKTANVTLVDTTQDTVTLAWQADTATVDEPPASGGTTTATLTAVATTAAGQPPDAGFDLNFTVTFSDGTASQPADYAAVSRTESFAVSDFSSVTVGGATRYRATRAFPITIAHDTADEENETLQVTLALSDPSLTYLLLGDAEATVTITDNDHVPVTLSWDDASITVDEVATTINLTAQVTTTKDKMPETGFAVDLSVASADMGATAGEDYTGVNSNVTLTPADFSAVDIGGQQRYRASRTYDVPILHDTTDEEDERFTATLAYVGAPQPHLTGSSARATVTIDDDDHVPVTLGWDATQFTVEEPTSPSGSSTLTLAVRAVTVKDKQPDAGFTFDYRARTADDGATAPEDYAALSATGTIARSDFARTSVDGQFRWVAEKEHAIAIAYDTTDEPVENFTATLAYVTAGMPHLLDGDLQATVSITDDIASLADLQTTVTPSAVSVMRGDRLTYSWTIANTGPAASTTTAVTLILDPQMTFVSATPAAQCMEDEAVVTCAIGVIEKDASVSGTVVADVDAAAAADIAFSAAAQGDQLERTPGDNEASLATTLVAPPEPVADLRAFATRAYVDLRWTTPQDNGNPITAYELERKADDEAFTAVGEPPEVEETTWRDEDVELNTTYVYRLRAVNEDGSAAWSEEVSATPRVPVVITGGGGGPTGPTPSEADFEWTVERDIEALDSGHDTPSGTWSDGATLWVLENGDGADDAIYAYDLESGERLEDREFELDETNRAPRGVWSDRTVIWVSDSGRNRLFAHDLATGQRLPERDIAFAERNRAARGIWSDEGTMWVLDGRSDALFAYDLASGELLAEYALDPTNDDPHGIWSDRVTIWVSDDIAKRLFAYRLPAPEGPAADDAERQNLERVRDEEFPNTILSRASNNSPRGIWSDGAVMYVADESDGKVYTYNMPDAIDARLASLTLSGVDIGEFDPGTVDYEGTPGEGVTETTVEAEALQPRTDVDIDPPDADAGTEGHQVSLDGAEVTVTVTSADGSRERVYRVRFGGPEHEASSDPTSRCFRGDVVEGFSLVVYEGGSLEDLVVCAVSRHVVALYVLDNGVYVPYIVDAPDFVNADFRELYAEGIPPLTPLIAGSNGPPGADPVAGGLTEDERVILRGSSCLHGEITTGFSFVVFGGGSIEELETCTRGQRVTALYALHEGDWVPFSPGAPDFANRPFFELYADGLPPVTPLVAKRAAPPVDVAGAVAEN